MTEIYIGVFLLGILISLLAWYKRSPFFNFIGIQIAVYGFLKGLALFIPPLPSQVVVMYMAMSVFAFFIYFSIREETFRAFLAPIKSVLADRDKVLYRVVIVFIGLPLLAAYITYAKVRPSFEPPVSARIVHPEPPTEIDFRGKKIQILGLENPLRKDTDRMKDYLEEGKKIYYQNCFFCHGDDLDGKGHFAEAFNPPPLPFRGTDTIAQLPESFVFWRIAKGWTGLPPGSRPWDSAMPAFEDILTEDEIWKVILFIYEASGNKPRTWE